MRGRCGLLGRWSWEMFLGVIERDGEGEGEVLFDVDVNVGGET